MSGCILRLFAGAAFFLAASSAQAGDDKSGAAPRVGKTFRDCSDCPEMVVIPAGSFMMGSPASEPEREEGEGPQHQEAIAKPFAAGKYTVSVAEFEAFIRDTDWQVGVGCGVATRDGYLDTPSNSFHSPGFSQDGSYPVVCVSWYDARGYTEWLAKKTGKPYRLLTEAEWEYAARAGAGTPFWWGKTIRPSQANYNREFIYEGGGEKGEFLERTVPVKSFEPNPWGLYQVHGNVWEWTQDCWREDYNAAPIDGSIHAKELCENRVARGGSWGDGPAGLRSARRFGFMASERENAQGFRVARDIDP